MHITRLCTLASTLYALYAIYDLDPCAQRQRNASFSLFLFLSLYLPLSGTSGVLPPILLGTLTEEGTRSCEGRCEERDVVGEGRDGDEGGETHGKKEE